MLPSGCTRGLFTASSQSQNHTRVHGQAVSQIISSLHMSKLANVKCNPVLKPSPTYICSRIKSVDLQKGKSPVSLLLMSSIEQVTNHELPCTGWNCPWPFLQLLSSRQNNVLPRSCLTLGRKLYDEQFYCSSIIDVPLWPIHQPCCIQTTRN